jgi:hypothetical protein
MQIRPGILIAIIAVFAVLFGGRYLGWFGGAKTPVVVTAPDPETKPAAPIEIEPPAPRPPNPLRNPCRAR